MMAEGSLVTLAALSWLFLKMAAEGETRQQLLEQGFDPRQVNRAVRYGRADELRKSLPRSGASSYRTEPASDSHA